MTSTLTAPRPAQRSRDRQRPVVHAITSVRPVRPAVPARPVVRFTRRGRLIVVLALVLLLFSLATLSRAAGWAFATDQGSTGSGAVATEWVVQPGETLWQVAVAVAPDADPRDTVARIVELNNLPDASVRAGQTLLVPA